MKHGRKLLALAFLGLSAFLALWAGSVTWGRVDVAELSGGLLALYQSSAWLPEPAFNEQVLIAGLLGAGALFAGCKLLWMIARGFSFWLRRPQLGEAGQAMTEVAVSFPVLLITTLILMQLALMFQARNVVTYAAFAAVRAAIVYIPADYEDEGPNFINLDGGVKIDKIQQAAALACVPISPKASTVLAGLPFIGDIVAQAFSAFSGMMSGLPGGVEIDNALQRFAYSIFATEVVLYSATENGFEELEGEVTWQYPGGPDVGVRVRHRYYLPIPVVNRFIGEPWSIISIPPFFSLGLPGQYTFIKSVAVLPLEGRVGNPPITGFWD